MEKTSPQASGAANDAPVLTPKEEAELTERIKARIMHDIYAEIGKTVVGRFTFIGGLLLAALAAWAVTKGYIAPGKN